MEVKHEDTSPAGGEIHKMTFSTLPLSQAEEEMQNPQNPKLLAQLHEQLVLLLIQDLDKEHFKWEKKNPNF